jgi:purine nucleosidase
MKHLLIDTDTASDDAVAMLMALRDPDVTVEAVTVVAGNCPLDTCVKNALVTVEKAGTYAPPVYAGMEQPMFRDQFTSEFVHGDDGMGNMDLPAPSLAIQSEHAVDIIIETAHKFAGELEIVTLGPLTNLAVALLREPELPDLVKHLYIMGGAGLGPGNVSPVAEFNFFVDAESAHIVIKSSIPKTVIGWDISMSDTAVINPVDIEHINSLGPIGEFAIRCNASLLEFTKGWGMEGFDLPDPTAVAVAIDPGIITKQFEAYTFVEYKSEAAYGHFVIDRWHLAEKPHNATIVEEIDASRFKQMMFHLLS